MEKIQYMSECLIDTGNLNFSEDSGTKRQIIANFDKNREHNPKCIVMDKFMNLFVVVGDNLVIYTRKSNYNNYEYIRMNVEGLIISMKTYYSNIYSLPYFFSNYSNQYGQPILQISWDENSGFHDGKMLGITEKRKYQKFDIDSLGNLIVIDNYGQIGKINERNHFEEIIDLKLTRIIAGFHINSSNEFYVIVTFTDSLVRIVDSNSFEIKIIQLHDTMTIDLTHLSVNNILYITSRNSSDSDLPKSSDIYLLDLNEDNPSIKKLLVDDGHEEFISGITTDEYDNIYVSYFYKKQIYKLTSKMIKSAVLH